MRPKGILIALTSLALLSSLPSVGAQKKNEPKKEEVKKQDAKKKEREDTKRSRELEN